MSYNTFGADRHNDLPKISTTCTDETLSPLVGNKSALYEADEVVSISDSFLCPSLSHQTETSFLYSILPQCDAEVASRIMNRIEHLANRDDAARLETMAFYTIAIRRLPAIMITLLLEMFVVGFIDLHRDTIVHHALIASFLPAISSVSTNIGLQSSTSTMRALATGHAPNTNPNTVFRFVFKELCSATFTALLCGVLIGVIGGLWDDNFRFGMVTGVSMIFSTMLAGILGTLAPFFFTKLRFDPALMAGPFETAFQDMTGMGIYLVIASIYL
ncbi:MgtE-domain-containing protein [Basidiobolus meristosporus CBS 931.73]|uniref:MgtE-domain-containing protein n=1 Tax=Basidiobolus meristosporus CBS 931.73 TaxID=1314790 RepID=A0A1Y1XKM6_9FUNG|nr:MgtE-domain-containing protein [Basidiobolus meristosporus CBS 931.73]|eukprot:ORX86310.1 MgtE-domain-containing protein [Basidiobolus meristosporus CBS 931.73]